MDLPRITHAKFHNEIRILASLGFAPREKKLSFSGAALYCEVTA